MVPADVNGYGRMIVNRGAVVAHDRSGVNALDNDRRANVVVRVNSVADMAASVAASTESVSLIDGKSERSRDRDACE